MTKHERGMRKPAEVALPLEAMDVGERGKPIRPGHHSALHLPSARRPPAACRAVPLALPKDVQWPLWTGAGGAPTGQVELTGSAK